MYQNFILTLKKIKHLFLNCPEEDLEYINKSYAICKTCGRKHFIFFDY